MHRLLTTPGGWTPDTEGVIWVEQSPAPVIFLTAADTEIQTVAAALPNLPQDFGAIRAMNLLQLQQQLTIDVYAETVLSKAKVILLRLLGGRSYWSYGFEVLEETIRQTGAHFIPMPGDDRPDPDLFSHGTVSPFAIDQLWRYFTEGGVANLTQAFQFLSNQTLGTTYPIIPPMEVPRVGLMEWQRDETMIHPSHLSGTKWNPPLSIHASIGNINLPTVGILFYRAHYLSGNLAPITALCKALRERQLLAVPVFISSLKDPQQQAQVIHLFQPEDGNPVQLILNTTSFAITELECLHDGGRDQGNQWSQPAEIPSFWQILNVPVLQVILSGGTFQQWQDGGLTPRDLAMNVALPELDGRIITRAISVKSVHVRHPQLETDVVGYEPIEDRIQFTADLAHNWVKLRQTPVGDRRVALILANYPNRDGRIANGVGLDTPNSCTAIFKALEQAGYYLTDIPVDGDDLIRRLTLHVTNDPEGREWRPAFQYLEQTEFETYFQELPVEVQRAILERWQGLDSDQLVQPTNTNALFPWLHFPIPIPGLQLGNIFVGIQPSRGYDLDPSFNYHAPDLEPPPHYLAFYFWLRFHFNSQAIIHVGKHGNLEWLPGKSIALSSHCYPEVILSAVPNLYPFIVNDPGEGAQAKRRTHAVILDHLTPPLTRAELYGSLERLEMLVDEYYEAQGLDPQRLPIIRDHITALIQSANLTTELNLPLGQAASPLFDFSTLLTHTDAYLCELKEAQIRDGLHIFGSCPPHGQLRDLIIAIARHPSPHRMGLTRAIARERGLDFDPLAIGVLNEELRNNGESNSIRRAIAQIETDAITLIDHLLAPQSPLPMPYPSPGSPLAHELEWIKTRLIPPIRQTPQEIRNLLRGLNGEYIPAGASGAPTRGRPEVLPTGRNFYSVDIRGLPTESAWDVGSKAAMALVERYTQEHGEYPRTLGLSVWGTATMRTSGDDIAEALALMGVRPVWSDTSRRVVDVEALPLSALSYPRVDVTLRISGFFRDAFPNLIDLFDQAVNLVAALDEPEAQNPLAAKVKQETASWQAEGIPLIEAEQLSRYRIFGSKPGAYGTGLQGLIESQNWTGDQDLAQAYLNWSHYAYTKSGNGQGAPLAFNQRLQQMQVVLHNQDNREHDLLDSDDYYQFQGGLAVAVRSLTGDNPTIYFGDHSRTEYPRIRSLTEEIALVYRSRVINPKWLAGAMRHGYKGAFELAATVDYLFAYDATTHCVLDYMYEGVSQAYVLDPVVQNFVQHHNPWALRDMAERLLEAHQRGLWSTAAAATLAELRAIALQAEGEIEGKMQPNSNG